jgi:hypothetical protein
MTLNTKALALTAAIVWGGCLFLTGLANFAFPAYGLTWLHAAGAIFGWAYNRVARRVGIRAP